MFIEKRSKKPFKNKLIQTIVVGEGIHPKTNNPTYILEDGSYIEQRMVKIIRKVDEEDTSWYANLRKLARSFDHLKK